MASSIQDLVSSLPKEKGWLFEDMHLYEGFWYQTPHLQSLMNIQNHFEARPSDILLISSPKSGTTWLKAILFATMNRSRYEYDLSTHPLLTSNPHTCVPFLEWELNGKPPFMKLDNIPSPRLFATHTPFDALPDSVQRSGCKIIYVCRNLKDVFVSLWYFSLKSRSKDLTSLQFDEAFERFCQGKSAFGPIWDHIKGYKEASLRWPDKFFFVTYEEMKRDSVGFIKNLADFLGCPFSTKEENDGVVKNIVELCSFDNLRNLEVNKSGRVDNDRLHGSVFFRNGQVGDWENYLTTQMAECLDKITREKLDGIFV